MYMYLLYMYGIHINMLYIQGCRYLYKAFKILCFTTFAYMYIQTVSTCTCMYWPICLRIEFCQFSQLTTQP